MMDFSLENFLNMDVNDFKISVPIINDSLFKTTYQVELKIISQGLSHKINKRYTEFEGLHDSVTFRYRNIKFQELPSKFQLFNKLETRRKFFEEFLNFMLGLAKKHKSIKKDIMKIIYDFIFSDVIGEKEKKTVVTFSPKSSMHKSSVSVSSVYFEKENQKVNSYEKKLSSVTLQSFISNTDTNYDLAPNQNALVL